MNILKSVYREDSKFKIFLVSILITGLAYGIQKGVIDNYLAEIVGMGEMDRGFTEFFREMPGLLLVFLLAVMYTFSAEKILKIGAVVMTVGFAMLSIVPADKVLVTIAIFLFSMGEHLQLGMKNAISLNYAKEGKSGSALGYQNSANQIGTLAGYFVVIISLSLIAGATPYKGFFIVATVISFAAMLMTFRLNSRSVVEDNHRFYFKKKFTKYYMLEIFYGARKQVFFTFGPYVLVLFYKANAVTISILFAVSAIACFLLSPVVGRIIDKVGYKIVMIMDTIILVVVCFFYGFAHHIFPHNVAMIICCVNYVLDSVISLASMASNVYVQDLSDSKEEVRATLSTGISVNHLITILIALFGGWIWQTLGMETLFILSAILGLCNSAYAATIKVKKK